MLHVRKRYLLVLFFIVILAVCFNAWILPVKHYEIAVTSNSGEEIEKSLDDGYEFTLWFYDKEVSSNLLTTDQYQLSLKRSTHRHFSGIFLKASDSNGEPLVLGINSPTGTCGRFIDTSDSEEQNILTEPGKRYGQYHLHWSYCDKKEFLADTWISEEFEIIVSNSHNEIIGSHFLTFTLNSNGYEYRVVWL